METQRPRAELADSGSTEPAPDPVDAQQIERVEEVVRLLGKTVRAHQLYEGRSPSYDRFVDNLRESLVLLWEDLPALVLDIGETRIQWEGHEVYRSDQRVESLAFLLFRDGIRQVIFLPGFEEEELGQFLRLLAQVHRIREDQDDLLTLFWEADLNFLRYRHIEIGMEGLEIPSSSGSVPGSVDPSHVRVDAETRDSPGWATGPTGAVDGAMDFQHIFHETVHLLEPAEMERLAGDLQRELSRNLWFDIVNGLIDRVEDGGSDRQRRIVQILTELLPGLISNGQIAAASSLLRELTAFIARREEGLATGQRDVEALFAQLAESRAVEELIRSVEDAPEAFPTDEFAELLGYFPVGALAPLIVGIDRVIRPEVRRAIEQAVRRLGARDPATVVSLLGAADPVLAAGAARLVGGLGVMEAAGPLASLLDRGEIEVRLAAVGALQELRAASAAAALLRVLDDPDRDVRIAAARALGALRYPPARVPLERLVTSRRLKDADVTERLAVFEAYGSVAGPEGIPVLDRLLNARGWLGRKAPTEIRASAALALGRISHPESREALLASADDAEPVVRSAVARSLRSGGG